MHFQKKGGGVARVVHLWFYRYCLRIIHKHYPTILYESTKPMDRDIYSLKDNQNFNWKVKVKNKSPEIQLFCFPFFCFCLFLNGWYLILDLIYMISARSFNSVFKILFPFLCKGNFSVLWGMKNFSRVTDLIGSFFC